LSSFYSLGLFRTIDEVNVSRLDVPRTHRRKKYPTQNALFATCDFVIKFI